MEMLGWCSQFARGRTHRARQGHVEEHQDCSGGRRSERRWRTRALIVVSAGRSGQDGVSRLQLGNLNNFSGIWSAGLSHVVSYLTLGCKGQGARCLRVRA